MATTKASISVTCPNCDKVLRLSARPATGKKIKCPSCEEPFVPDLDEEATAIQTKPGRSKAASNKSGGKRSRADEDDDDDEDDEDERPSIKKKKAKSGGMMLVVLLVVGGGLLLVSCGGLGLTAFVWPGFMLGNPDEQNVVRNKAGKPREKAGEAAKNLSAYILSDANMAAGADLKGLRNSNQEENLKSIINSVAQMNAEMPPEAIEIIRDCEKVMVSGYTPFGGKDPKTGPIGGPKGRPGKRPGPIGGPPVPKIKIAVAALMTPDGIAKIKKLHGAGPEEKLAGKYAIYRLNDKGKRMILAFPTDHIIVLTELDDAETTALLDNAAKGPEAVGQLAKMSALVEQKHLWAAWRIDADTRKVLQDLNPQQLAGMPGAPPQTVQFLQAMQKLAGGSVAVDNVAGNNWDVQLHLDFEDAIAASTAKDSGDGLKQFFLDEMRKDPKTPVPMIQDADKLVLQAQGTVLTAKLTISSRSVDAAKATMGGNMGFPDDRPKDIAKNDGVKQDPKGDGPKGDGPKIDGNPRKDFPPPLDSNPKKDISTADGKPKIDPPKVPSMNFTAAKLVSGQREERSFQLQAGKKYKVVMTSNGAKANTNVDLIVYRGAAGMVVHVADETPGPNGTVRFVVPAADTYRICVINRGPGNATSCTVTVTEE